MKKTQIVLYLYLILVLVGLGNHHKANAQRRVLTDTIYSHTLAAKRAYTIILPPGYEAHPSRKYPVLYLLHGMWGNNSNWVEMGHAKEILDIAVAGGYASEMIVVTPDAGGGDPNKFQNGYFDMPGWPYETFFFKEFLPHIETKYRILTDKGHRAVAGLSMGGGGAIAYGQHHPELFSSVYAISALVEDYEKDAGKRAKRSSMLTKTYNAVDRENCIKHIKKATPVQQKMLKEVAWFVDCGDDDYLLSGNLDFYKAMIETKIPCQLRVRDGGHTWEYWRSALYEIFRFTSWHFDRSN